MAELENVKGLKELRAALLELPKGIARNVLRGAVSAGAAVVRVEAKANAPQFTGTVAAGHPPPGTLKKAIYQKQIREKSNDKQQTFFVGVRQGKHARQSKKGLLDAFYGRFIEFGTSKMSAKPFMRPAFESKKDAAVQAIKAYLEKRIPDEVAKASRKK